MKITHIYKNGTSSDDNENKVIPVEMSKKVITIMMKSNQRRSENEKRYC